MRNYRPSKGGPRNATERHGTLRNLKGRLNLDIPHWNPPYFWRIFSKLPNIFLRRTPPFSQHPSGEWGECETTDQTKGRRGTPRGFTEPDGTPKFGYSALESAVFWWVFFKLSNIACFQRPFFPTPQVRKGECKTTDQTKGSRGTPRSVTERYGTWRNA